MYLNELDQFIKHQLKIKGYLRYVDDFVILGDNPATLTAQRIAIEAFLTQRLALDIHPHKIVLQRCNQGIDFLGSIIYPSHKLIRQRSVRALRRRLSGFKGLIFPNSEQAMPLPATGSWQRWLLNHPALLSSGQPSFVLLQRILSTINSYYGVFSHAQTYRLRKHIYHHELDPLKQFFLPNGPNYAHLRIKKQWLPRQ